MNDTTRFTKSFRNALAAAFMAVFASSLWASGEELLLDILLENGVITESQREAVLVEYRRRSEDVETGATVLNQNFSQDKKQAKVANAIGPVQPLVSRLKISGRLHPQYDYLISDLINTDQEDPSDNSRFHMRRIFLGMKARFDDHWSGTYLTDLSDGKVANQIARIEWKPNDANGFSFGYQKAPFGYEDTTPSHKVLAIERSASTRFWNESVNLGSYHTGIYYDRNWGTGWKSSLGLTNNSKGEADFSTSVSNTVSGFLRIENSGSLTGRDRWKLGVDLAHQPNGNGGDLDESALGVHADWDFGRNRVIGEWISGEIDLRSGKSAKASSWFLQGSQLFGEKWEGLVRVSGVDTDGRGVSLSSAIRRAPYSGYQYDRIDSAYLGVNYFVKGNDMKVSFGYEIAEGSDALNANSHNSRVKETVSGFRSRLQLLY